MESTTPSKYEYTPLPGPGYARLLSLDIRLDSEATLTGSLHVHDLDCGAVEYVSLSYSWGNEHGDTSLSRLIVLDGYELPITENLYDGLIQFSRSDTATVETPLLWVDAVCINQDDTDERGNQVSIMADIYRKASRLVICLGHGITKEEDQDVMDVLCIFRGEELGKPSFLELKGILPEHDQAHMHAEESRGVFQSQEAMPPIEYVPQQSTLIQFVPCLKWLRLAPGNSEAGRLLRRRMQSDFSPSDIPGLQQSEAGVKKLQESELFRKTGTAIARLRETLIRLCQRRYFTRPWILQELFHSKCVQLRWGVFSISADEFRQRLNDMDTLFQSSPWSTNLSQQRIYNHTLRALSVHDAMQPTLIPTRSGIGGALVECLCKFQSTVCADDRDRIYALMSIAGKIPLLAVNYHLTACQLFVAFAGKLIQ